MKKRRLWCWIVAMGAMLLLAALFLVFYNLYEDKKSGRVSEAILTELKQEIMENSVSTTETENSRPINDLYVEYENETKTEPNTDPSLEIDDSVYVGIISIPELGLELPVIRNWSYPNLRIAPCVYSGAAASNDLIIAAHNYKSHFGNLSYLYSGSPIRFTDVCGKVYDYEVVQIDTIGGYDVPSMHDGSGKSWNLTLFTCTLGGRSRVSVRAVRIDK